MYELIRAGERTWYIDCPAKMGLFLAEDGAWLIDSGSDKDAGRRVRKLLDANGWTLAGILNTHSNADHIGGNRFLQDRYHCPVYSTPAENALIRAPRLEPSFLYGGYPCKALCNKFLMAQESAPSPIEGAPLPEGLEVFPLPGHFFGMVGFRTPDGVCFLADCLSGEAVLEKYHVGFIYDVRAYLETLDWVETLEAKLFVPAHAPAAEDIRPLAAVNRAKGQEIAGRVLAICAEPRTPDEVIREVFSAYGLTMDFNQYVLVGSTVRSYLSYLCDEGLVAARFEDNRLLWERV